jgi:alginate O-acetyltransferase complex protein AlgI
MVFSSPIFLFLFLPLALAGFFLVPRVGRTLFLVAASLLFYAWGEKQIVVLLLASVILNWGLGAGGRGRRAARVAQAVVGGGGCAEHRRARLLQVHQLSRR